MARVSYGQRFAGDLHVHGSFHPPRHSPRRRGAGAPSIIAAIAIVLLAFWAAAATLYLLFRDDALRTLADRQIALVRAHDAEVGSLLNELERLKSLKLLDQERVERTLIDLARRQEALESRSAALANLAPKAPIRGAPEVTGSIPTPPPPPTRASPAKPSPVSDAMPGAQRGGRAESAIRLNYQAFTAELKRRVERIEGVQTHVLARMESGYGSANTRMRSVFTELGRTPPTARKGLAQALGGPFMPLFRSNDPFDQQLERVRASVAESEVLTRALKTIPIRAPLIGEVDITSGYGARMDPFLKQMALHTGLDFRADPGERVLATAAGLVTQAGSQGNYGLMVEIDHGNGLSTRYGHLSAIHVKEGAIVVAGSLIGRVGSTGRSTGPHLHYEIRSGGDPVDPQRFLRAGNKLPEGT